MKQQYREYLPTLINTLIVLVFTALVLLALADGLSKSNDEPIEPGAPTRLEKYRD